MFYVSFLCTFAEKTMDDRQQATNIRRLIGVNALLHFLVDGLCICCLYLTTAQCADIVVTYMTYNVLAFLTQPFTGWWIDKIQHKHWVLLGAVVLLTLAVLTASLSTQFDASATGKVFLWPMTILLGIGNSLFHVWGGKLTAVHSKNDIRALGVFVSTGAFGLAIGGLCASWSLLYVFLLSICVLAFMTQTLPSPSLEGGSGISAHEDTNEHGNNSLHLGRVRGGSILLLLIMLIVAGRSFAGEAFTSGITKGPVFILTLGAVSMAGKMAGGWFVKGLGMWKAVVLMVVGALVCFVGKNLHVAILLAGLFLVNCTMPVTLYWANATLKGREGLAFGLLAAALIPGYLLASDRPLVFMLLTTLVPTILIELGVLWFLKERRKKVFLSSIVVNVLTNVPLNLLVNHLDGGWGFILGGEVVVFIVEALWYFYFTRSIKQALIYSFLCNAISFLIGLLFWLIYLQTLVY